MNKRALVGAMMLVAIVQKYDWVTAVVFACLLSSQILDLLIQVAYQVVIPTGFKTNTDLEGKVIWIITA